jgi:TolB-like protein
MAAMCVSVLPLSLASAGQSTDSPATAATPAAPAATNGESASAPDAPAADAKRFLRVAVYDFSTDGLEPRVGRFVTDSMVAELRKLEGVSVVAMDEVRAMLNHEANRELVGCADGESCLSEIGDALGVDEIVVGSLASVGGASVVTIRRIDQANARAVGSISERLVPAGGEEFLAEVGPAVEKLYSDKGLRVGVTRGVPAEQARRLNPPPLSPWMPMATGGASLIVLAAAGFAGIASLGEEARLRELVADAKETETSGAQLVAAADGASSLALTANVLYASAAVVGLAAVAMVPFTDFSALMAETVE